MRLSDLLDQHGSLTGHRLVVEASDGTFLEVDSARLLKVMPEERFVAEGSAPESGDWSGPLEVPEDPAKAALGERVIVLSVRP